MFLELLQALGAFLGGLGAFIAGSAQLLAFLRKKDEERGIGHGGDRSSDWTVPPGLILSLSGAA
jgi:hypothetical protein